MKRRSFLKLLAGAACAVAAGLELALPSNAKAEIDVKAPQINPDYVNAPYEEEYMFSAEAFEKYKGITFAIDPFPRRFVEQGARLVEVFP